MKPVRLARSAVELPVPKQMPAAEYDPVLGYSIVAGPGGNRPLVEVAPDSTTQSKTFEAPVDDDQDDDDKECY